VAGAGAIAAGGGALATREVLLNDATLKLNDYFYHAFLDAGADPASQHVDAHKLLEFAGQYLPGIIAAAITAGGLLIGIGTKKHLNNKSNKDRYGIEMGWADYGELSNLIDLNEKIRKSREVTLVNFFPERPDTLVNELLDWETRFAKGKLVKHAPDRR
jgi:hypothetical protein